MFVGAERERVREERGSQGTHKNTRDPSKQNQQLKQTTQNNANALALTRLRSRIQASLPRRCVMMRRKGGLQNASQRRCVTPLVLFWNLRLFKCFFLFFVGWLVSFVGCLLFVFGFFVNHPLPPPPPHPPHTHTHTNQQHNTTTPNAPLRPELVELLEDVLLDDLAVDRRDAVDAVARDDGEERHAHRPFSFWVFLLVFACVFVGWLVGGGLVLVLEALQQTQTNAPPNRQHTKQKPNNQTTTTQNQLTSRRPRSPR